MASCKPPMTRILLLAVLPFSLAAQKDVEKRIQTEMIVVASGGVVKLPEGNIRISRTLSLDGKKDVTIRGSGIDKTVLSFSGQESGAEGIRISDAENIVLEDLTVRDAKGDLIKAMMVKGITFRRVKAEWTGRPSPKNGGYGLYPVQCSGVLIDSCIAIGASDAGIYVGQSRDIIVRRCLAERNVAGIEIENSLHAQVYDNIARDNTGGILVFDLPDLVQKSGGHVSVHDNLVEANNRRNFAPKGNIVAKVPRGTGVLVLAARDVEVSGNRIFDNRTVGTGVISYFMTENRIRDKDYNPYPERISIHGNHFERKPRRVPMQGRMGQLYRFKLRFGRQVPHIVYDGIRPPGAASEAAPVCLRDNRNQSFAELDAEHDFRTISRDARPYACPGHPPASGKALKMP